MPRRCNRDGLPVSPGDQEQLDRFAAFLEDPDPDRRAAYLRAYPPGKIHMTETRQALDGSYGWICRCGETETDFPTRNRARSAGDAHLTAANGTPDS